MIVAAAPVISVPEAALCSSRVTPIEDLNLTLRLFAEKTVAFVFVAILLGACATGTHVTRVQNLAETADAPYENILVIALFESFDARRYLEKEVVQSLSERGIEAVASTSMMDSRTPATRQTFVAMLDKIGADAVLVSQLASFDIAAKRKDMNPESTYNFRPTYYYNVWSVELTEYVEPQGVQFDNSIVLATQLYSALSQETVWGIESKFKYVQKVDALWDYSVFIDQAKTITTHL